jgi:hypothetical protein
VWKLTLKTCNFIGISNTRRRHCVPTTLEGSTNNFASDHGYDSATATRLPLRPRLCCNR